MTSLDVIMWLPLIWQYDFSWCDNVTTVDVDVTFLDVTSLDILNLWSNSQIFELKDKHAKEIEWKNGDHEDERLKLEADTQKRIEGSMLGIV